jgi:hypothetical protein
MYHLASRVMRPVRRRFVRVAHVPQGIASTCGVVGAAVTTKASPGGCRSIHQSASLDIVCDFETSCDALNAL